jgi:anaerobic ribonucleoside-triphosphate reductase activating protein
MTTQTSDLDGDPSVINLADILQESRANGPGLRDVFWVQGCSINCLGCQNHDILDHEPNRVVPVDELLGALDARLDAIHGITISGGEPLEQLDGVGALLKGTQARNLSTVVYTGHVFEELVELSNPAIDQVLDHCDLLIDGPFVADERVTSHPWIGSKNQRLLRLSDRFSPADLSPEGVPVEEFHLSVEGQEFEVFQTGIKDTEL